MRELYFRGKRMDNSEWVQGGSVIHFDHDDDHLLYIAEKGTRVWTVLDDSGNLVRLEDAMYCRVDPATVGQFTGLTDKNGQWIYEGDILRMDHFTPPICEVRFIEGAFCLLFDDDGLPVSIHYIQHANNPSSTVIGNVHDNPELMRHE